jgi:hypothetical protein
MKVRNLTSNKGRKVPNQFELVGRSAFTDFDGNKIPSGDSFQSYDSMIAHRDCHGTLWLDRNYWDYSVTTSRWRNRFTRLSTEETKKGLKDGSIKLTDLNGYSCDKPI